MNIDLSTSLWQKAKRSGGGNCVEVTRLGDEVFMRNSRFPDASVLRYTLAEFGAFLDDVKGGDFDQLAH